MVGVALAITLVLKTFLVQAFVIPSGSMEQTIRVDDRVVVDKLTPWFGARPDRGDVVVFKDPGGWLRAESGPAPAADPVGVRQIRQGLTFIGLLPSGGRQDLIKRVIAVGGDTVRCCTADGRVSVNGVSLDEPYLMPGDAPSAVGFEVRVPPGRLFVMGDHRANSADSRFHLGEGDRGTVPEERVVGRAFAVAWPLGHWRRLEEPATYAAVPDVSPPDAGAGATAAPPVSHRLFSQDRNGMVLLPSLAELPLVMGVVGLLLLRGRRFARSEEWMWGTWRSAHGPDTISRRTGRESSPSIPPCPWRAMIRPGSPRRVGIPLTTGSPGTTGTTTGATGGRRSGPSGRNCRC
ncbi:signal peptidase I [Streptomyces clavuligerus]|nr:signal peptidase I [Streptomyces clavuligerus]